MPKIVLDLAEIHPFEQEMSGKTMAQGMNGSGFYQICRSDGRLHRFLDSAITYMMWSGLFLIIIFFDIILPS